MDRIRFDLDECPSGVFCFQCGQSYLVRVDHCAECGSAVVPTSELERALRESLPPGDGQEVRTRAVFELVRTSQDRELARVRGRLVERGVPHAVVPVATEQDGQAVRETAVLADADDFEALFRDPVLFPEGALVALTTANSDVEAMEARRRLDEAGISFEEERFTPQFGIIYGDLAHSRFLVIEDDLEAARAALAPPPDADLAAAAGAPGAPAATTEPLDGESLADGEAEPSEASFRSGLDQMRLARRFKIARFCMVVMAIVDLGIAAFVFAVLGPVVAALSAAFGLAYIWATWSSYRGPASAFYAAFVISVVQAILGFVFDPILGVPGVMTFFATYWAAAGARMGRDPAS